MCVYRKWLWFFNPGLLSSSFAHSSARTLLLRVSDLSKNWFTETPNLSNPFLPPTFSVNAVAHSLSKRKVSEFGSKKLMGPNKLAVWLTIVVTYLCPARPAFPLFSAVPLANVYLETGTRLKCLCSKPIGGLRYHLLHMLYQFIRRKLFFFLRLTFSSFWPIMVKNEFEAYCFSCLLSPVNF